MRKRPLSFLLALAALGGVLAVLRGFVAAPAARAGDERAVDTRLPIGMNLRMVGPRSREWVFVDAMKSASAWRYADDDASFGRGRGGRRMGPRPGGARGSLRVDQGTPTREERMEMRQARRSGETVPTDPCGWPRIEEGRAVTCVMMAEQHGRYPKGTYVCTWRGAAEISFERAGKAKGEATRGDHGEWRLPVEVDPARGEIVMRVEPTDPEDPVRDIHVWMPGFEGATSPFHPLFLERLSPFGVLRFYPWMRPFSSSGRWENRPVPADARQSGDDGVAVEFMVALCNELKAEPWFCMPHTADDEYVHAFATLVRDTLHADAKVWVEYSNEVWNSSFVQAQWVRAEARRRGVTTAEVTSGEAARMFRIWREVFGDDEERVVRVAAGQLHNPGIARVLCRGLEDQVDAIAVGAYFGVKPGRDGVGPGVDADGLMTAARRNLDSVVMDRIGEHKKLAEQVSRKLGRHVALVTYEGGQHLVAGVGRGQGPDGSRGMALSPRVTDDVQNHPGMYDAYRALIEEGRRRGLELFVAYDFVGGRTHADTFGHLRYLDEPLSTAPKFRALVEDWVD